ncbi:MAG: hypothetical protein ACREQ5_18475, partial [Candidatus Dormibacteria bacterium]
MRFMPEFEPFNEPRGEQMIDRRPRRWYVRCGTAGFAILMLAGAAGVSSSTAPVVRADGSGTPDRVGQWT